MAKQGQHREALKTENYTIHKQCLIQRRLKPLNQKVTENYEHITTVNIIKSLLFVQEKTLCFSCTKSAEKKVSLLKNTSQMVPHLCGS